MNNKNYFTHRIVLLLLMSSTIQILQAQVVSNWIRQHAETSRLAYEEGNRNKAKLIAEGKWNLNKMPGTVFLRTPIERMPNMHEYYFYHIPNTVDLDPSPVWSNTWCMFSNSNVYGMHTFDGCTGTEFRFAQRNYQVIDDKIAHVTAAADGIIVAKADGNYDKNCYQTVGPENFIALEHTDGTRTYYYNLKNGDQNPKPIGSFVREGELIGYPGGSGVAYNSNYHENARLFFELRDNANNVINPFGAPGCLGLPQYPSRFKDSTNLKAYIVNPLLLHLKSFKHDNKNITNCGNYVNPSYTNHFNPGDSIYIELAIKNYNLTLDSFYIDIYNPLGVQLIPSFLRHKGTYTVPPQEIDLLNYAVPFVLPTGGLMIPGTYTVVLSYRSDLGSSYNSNSYHYITVGCQSNYSLSQTRNGEAGFLAGSTIDNYETCNSGSRVRYVAGNEVILHPGFNAYNGSNVMIYTEPCVVPPRMENPNENMISNVNSDMTISPNPAADQISIKIPGASSKTTIKIYNSTMQLIKSFQFTDAIENTIPTTDLSPGIYFIIADTETKNYTQKLIISH